MYKSNGKTIEKVINFKMFCKIWHDEELLLDDAFPAKKRHITVKHQTWLE